ncbi:MAG: hypothetical protein QXH67_07390 [Candidatus Bathyarchaeia archaeon]
MARGRKIWAAKSKRLAEKVSTKDHIVLYVVGTNAFCSVLRLVGDWKPSTEIIWADEREEGRIKYPFQIEAEIVREGVAEIRDLLPRLSFIKDKQNWGIYLKGTPANMGRPIQGSDYQAIVEAMASHPLPQDLESLLKGRPMVRVRRGPEKIEAEGGEAGEAFRHNEVRDMIYEIGRFEGRIPEREYPIDNLRLDVVWKTIPSGNPRWVFEVQMAGNFYEALTKLKHAWDKWNSKPYLVTTGEYIEQARWLLEGSYHEMREDARIVDWEKIVKLYKLLREAYEIRSELRL